MEFVKDAVFYPIIDFVNHIFQYVRSDERHVRRNTIIQILIATIAFVLLVRIYPMGLIQKHEYSKQLAFKISERETLTGDSFSSTDKKLQTIYFSNPHLYQMTLYMNCVTPTEEADSEKLLFRIYDDKFSCIYEEEYTCGDIERDGCLKVTPDMNVDTQQKYYYEIIIPEGITSEFQLPLADRSALSQTENSSIYIDGIINDEVCLIADYDYTEALSLKGIVFYYILILLAAFILYLLIMWSMMFIEENFYLEDVRFAKCIRTIASIIIFAAGIVMFVYSVVLNIFGSARLDRGFYTVAIITAVGCLMVYMWFPVLYPRQKKGSVMPVDRRISLIWRNYIQIMSFGLLFYALCQYTNADREYYHYTNTRWMLIFLSIALLMTYTEKQFMNKLSGVWLLLGTIGSFLYCNDVAGDEQKLMLAKLTCGVVLSWGLLLINIMLNLNNSFAQTENKKEKLTEYVKKNKVKFIYGILWIVFSVFMYCYRFEKVWVFTATLPFFAMFFLRITDASRSRFLKNLTDGILVSFGLVTWFSLMHRPYHYWMLYRYAGIFHTVACTGMYLVVVLATAMAKLYGRLKEDKKLLKHNYKEYFIVGCTVGFILLTMSRTAFLTSGVLVLLIIIITAVTYKKKPLVILKEVVILGAVCVLCFPLVFSAVRTIPAVVNDPVRYDIEHQDDSFMICKGDPIDSDKYMSVDRFFRILFDRVGKEADDEETSKNTNLKITAVELLADNTNKIRSEELKRVSDTDYDERSNVVSFDSNGADVSNGRFGIYMDYIKSLEINGHEKMSPVNSEGEEYAHAHNSYLQVAYNFGIIAGVIFLLICALSLWKAVMIFYKKGDKYSSYLLPFALVVVFGFVSLTEWAFHPCIPAGFAFLIVQVLLIRD